MKVLIIEDEYNLGDAIRERLLKEKYLVDLVTDGEKGLYEALTGVYDIILLDIMLPKVDGITILKEIRKENITSKVIMLTAKVELNDKLMGFNNGADDYLTKPFHIDELVARIDAILRRSSTLNQSKVLEYKDIKFNIKECTLINTTNNKQINIIGKEIALLEMFLQNKKQILSKEVIFNKIWGYYSKSDITVVEAYISFLRKKLKLINSNIMIKSIRNLGYRLEDKSEKNEK